jgi:molybdenum cofactor guanylyltransferase
LSTDILPEPAGQTIGGVALSFFRVGFSWHRIQTMSAVLPFSAVVLAAGRSTRMGRDKALLEIDGQPLWRRQRDVLVAAGAAEIFLSARPDQPWVRGIEGFDALLHDAQPDCGPIVGLTAALERATQPHVAVLAIDLPRMTSAWFDRLLRLCGSGVGVVGRRAAAEGGHFEPLAAIYPRELKWPAWEALARGDYGLQRLIATAIGQGLLRTMEIGAAEAVQFENWNEPTTPPGSRDPTRQVLD